MINSTEQSIGEATRLLEENMVDTNPSCWKKDFSCCCITMLSSLSLSTMGLEVLVQYMV